MSNEQSSVVNYWDQAEEGAREEGGGGVIGKARVVLGYWVYVTGIVGNDREKCLFVPKSPDKAGRKAARLAAYAFAASNGVDKKNARWSAITRLYRDECVSNGEPVTWDADRFEVTPLWTIHQDGPSAAKLVKASLSEHNVPGGKDFYGRFGWLPDPYKVSQGDAGMTAEDQAGNPKYPTVCTVLEKYANKAEALEAIAGQGESVSSDSKWGDEFPSEGWEDTDWETEAQDAKMVLVEGVKDLDAWVSEEFDKDVTWLIRMLSTGGITDKEIASLTSVKRGKVRKALAA